MEEVPAHVHPGPIVSDVLSRQHEHISDLIWSGDHKTCYTDLQCRHFGRNLFQCYSTAPLSITLQDVQALWGLGIDGMVVTGLSSVKKEPLEVWIPKAFNGSETDDDLILRARGFILLLIG
ncbi:hypothetical protein M9H77_30912 [Catharanthus roseus]|uniref:Uncharacterized protein n=1 Tax=Catharanthus roseus TaxID=4058 RepID=A0ACB9ZYK8_CATRO|nr:hypothetical protein M9H77_30912 [Catharanthus roseus]